ncbi:class I SAM-dependent methyltransferase [Ramlibacter rhizophilus]|uniref:class I SAM-dependent methyltransferase n=1 Tax=Ramlibacter rhizophilus TaxID=1781167 RepID=UPI0014324A12|nr:class I SAM-dependent methyltransferase [Ramlibacter rhizophilus]
MSTIDGKTDEKLLTVSCNGCGLGRIDPMPTESELEQWYESRYRQAYKGCEQPRMHYVLRAARNALDRYQWLLHRQLLRENGPSLRTLDIGSSSGEFVSLMVHKGHDAHGVEPHRGYAEYAQSMGLQVANGSLSSTLQAHAGKSFDLVTMFHVLEHLADPVSALRRIGACLKEDGILFIEVPDATRFTSPKYMFFKAHTLYLTPGSLQNVLRCAGFELVRLSEPGAGNVRWAGTFRGVSAQAATIPHSHELVTAQERRRWAPYLLHQAQKGEPFGKLAKRYGEKRVARRFDSPRELMDHVYGVPALLPGLTSPAPGARAGHAA